MMRKMWIVSIFVFVGCVFAQPKMYKGVHLSDGMPALLDLEDSSLVRMGIDWVHISEIVYTDRYPSTPRGYFAYVDFDYKILVNPMEFPVTQWGYGRIVIKKNAGLWMYHSFIWGWNCELRSEETVKLMNQKTPDPEDPVHKGKQAWWVWEPNPQGYYNGRLELR